MSNAPAASYAKVESIRVSHHRFTGLIRPSLRNGFNGFLRALPGDRLFVTVPGVKRQLHCRVDASIGASGPHDFAVRFQRCPSNSAKASIASRPTFVTMANVPLLDKTAAILPVIWGSDQSRDLRRINTTGKSVEIEQFVSTE